MVTPQDTSEAAESAPCSGGQAPPSISKTSIAWPILFSLAVLAALGYFTYDAEAYRQMAQAVNGWMVGLVVLSLVIRIGFGAWRMSFISHGRLTLWHGLRVQLAWDFFSNVTPSAIGGGPFAAYFMAKDRGITVGEATSILLFAMLLDQFFVIASIIAVIIAAFYMAVVPPDFGALGGAAMWFFFGGLMVYTVFFAYVTLVKPELIERIAKWFVRFKWLRRYEGRVQREVDQLKANARVLRRESVGFYLKGALLTAASWIARPALVVLIILSVFPLADAVLAFMRTLAMLFASMIMPTPGGAGGVEALYYGFLNDLMPTALVAPTLFVWRVLGYYLFIGLGVFVTTRQVQRAISRRRSAPASTPPTSGDGATIDAAVVDAEPLARPKPAPDDQPR
ncbi:MAG: lysylphosphatidylglycerol synthase transmembrane domain-containing protein [Bacteroidota bacterium]